MRLHRFARRGLDADANLMPLHIDGRVLVERLNQPRLDESESNRVDVDVCSVPTPSP